MNRLFAGIARRSVTGLVRLACGLAILGLAIMSLSIVSGRPLPVMFALSFGHLVGAASLACFFLAVVIDAVRKPQITASDSPSKPSEE